MAVITRLRRSALEDVLHKYEVGVLGDYSPASEGIENTNYLLTTTNGTTGETSNAEYVLTIIEDDRVAQRELMVQVLARCHEYGLPVAPVVRTRRDEAITSVHDKAAVLCPRLKGRHLVVPLREHCGAIGRFLARMHLATQTLDGTDFPYIRDSHWLVTHASRVAEHLESHDRHLLLRSVESIKSALSRTDVQTLPQGIIHGDLFRDNALFNEYGLTGVVDFHHASHGFWLYDLAVAVNDWCVTKDALDKERAFALLREYNAIRPLHDEEYWFFPMFLLYASVAFWLSRLAVTTQSDLHPDRPVRDPAEMARLAQRHISRPFRLHALAIAK